MHRWWCVWFGFNNNVSSFQTIRTYWQHRASFFFSPAVDPYLVLQVPYNSEKVAILVTSRFYKAFIFASGFTAFCVNEILERLEISHCDISEFINQALLFTYTSAEQDFTSNCTLLFFFLPANIWDLKWFKFMSIFVLIGLNNLWIT